MRATLAIISACVVIFIIQNIIHGFTETFSLIPAFAIGGQFWQFFTYMFLHGSLWHITINMLILFMFGVLIERAMGWKWYVTIFILSGIGSGLFHIALTGDSLTLMLGASGGVFDVLTAYAFMFPDTRLYIFPIPIPIKAVYAIIGIAILEFLLGVFNIMPQIASFGHLGGIITGLILMIYWKYYRKRGLKTKNEIRNFEFYWE